VPVALAVAAPGMMARYQEQRVRGMKEPELEALVRRQPKDARARYQLGLRYAQANRFRDASREFLAVLDQDPVRPDVLNDLGVSYLLQDRYYEALVALQGAIAAKPDYAPAYANLGRLHIATKMAFTASKELANAVRLDPNNADALCDLGVACQQTHSFKGAEEAYQKALRLSPKLVKAHVGLGAVYTSMGRRDEAEAALTRALALAPEDPTALITLADARFEKASTPEEFKSARELYEKAARADPSDEQAWYGLGRADLRLARPAAAVANLERVLTLAPQHMAALHQLEKAYRAAGKTAAAERAGKLFKSWALRDREESRLEEYIAHAPGDWNAKARLTELYLQSGKRAMALLVYRQLKEGRADHPKLPALTRALNPPTIPPVPPSLTPGTGTARP
jgi:Flp pilus assembly protein TadD